jgi:Ca2+/H+ antiporter, TMEM165/GDT1 family
LFGMRWLRKAILRAAGIISLHDEGKIFAKQTKALAAAGIGFGLAPFDGIAFITTFKAVMIEGLEVVFIVIAVGATGHMLIPASIGAAAAAIIVVLLGIVLHRPLARVPENTLKFSVGILLSAFGVFWIGEGLRLRWPGEDWAILGLAAGFFIFSALGVALAKRHASNEAIR